MNYPLFDRSEGFYHSLALLPDWENRLVRRLDIEEFAAQDLDTAELSLLHFNQLGYTIREIAWYYGVKDRQVRDKIKKVFHRLAVRPLEEPAGGGSA